MNKNVYKVSSNDWIKKVSWGFFAFFMVSLVLLGVFRLFAVSILKGSVYRSIAENEAYVEKTVTAKRGTIYDSEMNVLSSSYGVYDLVVDPTALQEKTLATVATTSYYRVINNNQNAKISKNDPIRDEIKDEVKIKFYNALANGIAYILDDGLKEKDDGYIKAEDIFEILKNSLKTKIVNNKKSEIKIRYAPIAKEISVAKKQKIDFLLNSCFYNYYYNLFVHFVTDKDARYYDYKTGEMVDREEYDSANSGLSAKMRGIANSCIIREGEAFIIEEGSKRTYPEDGYCSSFLGIANSGTGVYGVESYYDSILSGKDGQVSGLAVNYSGQMKEKSGVVKNDVQQGGNLVLTIRSQIQKILEDNLKTVYYQYSADETYGIVMNCKTGEIYAMGNYPNYDLNNPQKLTDKKNALAKAKTQILDENKARGILDDEGNVKQPTKAEIKEKARNNQWSCFCVNYPYELGSTFKIFTASAGIEEGVIDPDSTTPFYTCPGAYTIIQGEKPISCSHGTAHGSLDLSNALIKSCNGFFIHLGLSLGADAFTKYFKSFGFTEKTGIDVYGEVTGYSITSNMTRINLGSTAYGQTATITPIQLITAASAIANGGKLVTPYIVEKVIDSDGNLISKAETKVKRRVISESTSKTMIEKMKGVIYDPEGTAYSYFHLDGYEAAGKTGSGEIQGLGRGEAEYSYKYTGSFVAFAPADDPEVIILFGVRNPEGGYIPGGKIAGPPASTIMQTAMKDLNIPKSSEQEEGVAPSLEGVPILSAKTIVSGSGFASTQFGKGKTVVIQNPAAGTKMPESGLIALFTSEESYKPTAKIPDFKGMTKAQAISAALEAGVNITFADWKHDKDKVFSQDYASGTEVYPGSIIKVYFSGG